MATRSTRGGRRDTNIASAASIGSHSDRNDLLLENEFSDPGDGHQIDQIYSSISLVPGGRPVFEEPFLNVLQTRFLLQCPAVSATPGSLSFSTHHPNVCSAWISAAIHIVGNSSILENGLLALSSHIVAADLSNPGIVEDSRKRYEKTIGALRNIIGSRQFAQATRLHMESLMLTSIACAKYEVSSLIRFCHREEVSFVCLTCMDCHIWQSILSCPTLPRL